MFRAVTILILLLCSGCCSLFRSGSQSITVDSQPPGAKVKVGEAIGTTPFTSIIPKGKEYVIVASFDGSDQSQTLTRKVDGLYWVNILVWPGLIVDAVTGTMHEYDPTGYNFDFTGQ